MVQVIRNVLAALGLNIRLGKLDQHQPAQLRLERLPLSKSPMPAPRVSVVTPSFNQAQFVGHTLESVLSQRYPNLEYIVIDGASSDSSQRVIGQVGEQLSYWTSEADNGQAEAINKGFCRATGEIMGYLNSDDLLLPGALNAVGELFCRRPDIDVVYGHRILIDENGMAIGRWMMPPHSRLAYVWADYIPQETMFWRRSVWERVGGRLDESFQFALDWDLISRFDSVGARFYRLPRFLAAFRVHATQKTSSQMESTGAAEGERVMEQLHGRQVGLAERRWRTIPYLLMHLLQDASGRRDYLKLIH